MEIEKLSTTVVGSFPLENTDDNFLKTIDDQINLGIDFPCYGQLVSMIDQFLEPISERNVGLKKEQDKYIISDDLEVPKESVALEYGESLLDYLNRKPYLKSMINGTKACLTGPFTLASEILLTKEASEGIKPRIFKEPRAIMVERLVDKLADIMKRIGRAYCDMGIDIISMDEPILGLLVGGRIMFHSEDFIVKTLNKAVSGIDSISSIHVCGDISPKLRDLLLKTNVDILDHEFQGNDKNFDIFKAEHFREMGKYLAFGAVETKISPIKDGTINDYIEDISTIKRRVQKAIEIYGEDNLIIKPDCGFMPLKEAFGEKMAYEITLKKLNNMVLAVKRIKE
jgi:5-methyltetrahydropteroyltriglutamate--homocysteine methyltransferase